MKRRIYSSIIWLVLPCILLLAVLLSIQFHKAAKNQELAGIRNYAKIVSSLLNNGITAGFLFSDYDSLNPDATRVTLIAPGGAVLMDSRLAADRMDNHAGRPEVVSAMTHGVGEALRYSDSLFTETYYYAVRLDDGSILRVSRPVGGVAEVFAASLPVAVAFTVLILIIANFAAHRLTDRIMTPLKDISFEGENVAVYDELLPYVNRLDGQKREIDEKIAELSDRAGTIEAITGNMNEGLILIDSGATVLSANNSARDIFGDNMEHRSILHIYREAGFQRAVNRCLSGENVEISMERAGRVFSVSFSPVYSGAAARGAVILFQDATERYRAEKQRREFSANVSHELKTPLTTISALSEMIGNGIAKESDVKNFAARITEQAGRLLVLIDDIIRLSEFDEGGAAGDDTVFDIRDLAESVINALKDNAGGIEIDLVCKRFDVSANRRMIDELLFNLIDNGVKYNREGGRVTVDIAQQDNGMCRISVSDTGIGIPAQHQEHVFERFYRVDKSRSKKTGGTGLGLSIVKHIAEYHGGGAELRSVEGEGTTVTCYIS